MGTISIQVDVPEVLDSLAEVTSLIMSNQDRIDAEQCVLQGDFDALKNMFGKIKDVEQQQADAVAALKAENPAIDLTAFDAVRDQLGSLISSGAALEVAPSPSAPAPAPGPVPAPLRTGRAGARERS
jgi:hypothetical protein